MGEQYKHILVAVDLANKSDVVLEKALMLSRKHDAKLTAIHVITAIMPYLSYSFSADIQDTLYNEGKQHFAKFCESYGIKPESQKIAIGSPRAQIIGCAENMHCDLIVVGTHGEQHILPPHFGSTASGILTRAKCDVLMVSNMPLAAENVEPEKMAKTA